MQNTRSQFEKPLNAALSTALDYLDALETAPVPATQDTATLRSHLRKPLAQAGMPAEQVVSELARDVAGGLIGSAGGRFFGWVIGGSLPAALAADWLASAWDQNGAIYATSPAAAVVEEVAGEWLKEIFGLPAAASFAFVTGCQMAHVTCLAAARHALLDSRGWDVERAGLSGAPQIRIVTSDQYHGTFQRAARLLGIGLDHIVQLPTGNDGTLAADTLERGLAEDTHSPTLVLLQAGDVNAGANDHFESLIPIAKRHSAWVHVDGAMGLWAAASPAYSHLTRGIGLADSWATDAHKWLNVPYDCGVAIVAHPGPHRAAMCYSAPYFNLEKDARDQMDWNPDWSRRARGFATYAALRQLGRDGVADLVSTRCKHTTEIVLGIGALPGSEVVAKPVINQGLVRFLDSAPGATEADHARRTDEVIAAILQGGEAFFGGTTWRGKRAMRVSVSSWQTTDADVARVIKAVADAMKSVEAASRAKA
jgi:glutamate/tyrosine decarboxylase-like PLP-dependent enzyme